MNQTRSSWNDWNFINLDEFREQFPQFRHTELSAIEHIISGAYRKDTTDVTSFHELQVFNAFKANPEAVEKAQAWLADLRRKTQARQEAPITPTVIGKKAKH